ncbi:unnamed protein product [Protopolystoma xenopodis]|uniref:Uncharacterized protein n=1 Tax=Protopolystoma xenopodis TaxID=117903 RepID=A0A448WF29_9PLAT|nr:unnamed protein product [Protopolystoma xenopodis]
MAYRPPGERRLDDLLGVTSGGPLGRRLHETGHSPADYTVFLDLVRRMLIYEPARRIRPADALAHRFFRAPGCGPSVTAPSAAAGVATPPSASSASSVTSLHGAQTSLLTAYPIHVPVPLSLPLSVPVPLPLTLSLPLTGLPLASSKSGGGAGLINTNNIASRALPSSAISSAISTIPICTSLSVSSVPLNDVPPAFTASGSSISISNGLDGSLRLIPLEAAGLFSGQNDLTISQTKGSGGLLTSSGSVAACSSVATGFMPVSTVSSAALLAAAGLLPFTSAASAAAAAAVSGNGMSAHQTSSISITGTNGWCVLV